MNNGRKIRMLITGIGRLIGHPVVDFLEGKGYWDMWLARSSRCVSRPIALVKE
jgi:hypothetical protein